MSNANDPKPVKLTIDDLVKSQQQTERHLAEIVRCMNALANSSGRRTNKHGWNVIWGVFGAIAWLGMLSASARQLQKFCC